MSHLSPEQLSAHADGALTGRALERAVSHLAGCERCREELDRIVSGTRELGRALEHDPGDAYFASFADRVTERIANAGAAPAPLPEPPRLRWWSSPAVLAWAGGAAAVVVGGAVVLLVARQPQLDLARRAMPPGQALGTSRSEEATPPLTADRFSTTPPPAASAAPQAGAPATTAAPLTEAPAVPPPAAGAPAAKGEADQMAQREDKAVAPRNEAAPGHAYEVRSGPGDEIVPVRPSRRVAGRERDAAPPPAPPGATGEHVRKPQRAEPLELQGRRSLVGPSVQGLAAAEGAPSRLCGTVVDDHGRAVAGAQVVVADLGVGVTTDASGRFCVDAPAGTRTLSVMAVGFQALRRTVDLDARTPELALALRPVTVLEQPLALGSPNAPAPSGANALGGAGVAPAPATALKSSVRGGTPPAAAALEPALAPFAQLPDTVRSLARGAQRLTLDAASRRSASKYDAAANEWEKVLRRAPAGAAEMEARRRLAEARYQAWAAAPSDRRATAAVDALTAFLVRAPSGPARDQAALWLDRIRH